MRYEEERVLRQQVDALRHVRAEAVGLLRDVLMHSRQLDRHTSDYTIAAPIIQRIHDFLRVYDGHG